MALKFSIQSGALPLNATAFGFRGSEGFSRPYVFDIYVNVLGDDEVALEEVIGSKGRLVLSDGLFEVASWGGVIATFELMRAVKGNALYLARIVPQLWQLTQTRHSRMLTKKKAPDVIKAILEEEGILDYDIRCSGSYAEEEHVCQYKESSLDFIHRWCEREGIYYFFEQSDKGEKVVFTDAKEKHKDMTSGPVRYHPTLGKDRSAARHFESFVARHATLPATVKLGDYDYEKPALDVVGSSKVSSSGVGEIRHYGNRFFTPDEGSRIATIRAEELRARGTTYHATGSAVGLSPGVTFSLEEHPHLALNKAYVTTAAEHFGYLADLASGWGDAIPRAYDDVYHNEVYLIAADLQYRHPSNTPWPRIDGFENGVVDGAASSEYAQIDKSGRYLVKFKFDEGTLKDGKASTYVRMMQPHGGSAEGFHFPLRKQTEVVFIFMGGDPDRPVIAGVVPNAHKPSPVVQANHTQNIIQTGGGSFITIEDLSSSQFINIYSPMFDANLYLGCDRPEGPFGLKSGKGPNAVEQGEYKEELGAFNFQLYTKKNGEIFTQGNLNLVAYKKLQLEGQTGVIEFSGDYWRKHVKGETEEHRVKKVHHRYDDVVDYDWKGPYTLDVELDSTIHYKGKLTQTTDKAVDITNKDTLTVTTTASTTISDKASLTHFIGAEANMCGAATHTLMVTGDQLIDVSKKATWNIGLDHTLTCGANMTWTITGEHKIDSATWHETVKGKKSEHIYGWKNDLVVGLHTDNHIGIHQEAHVVGHLETTLGVKGDLKLFSYDLNAMEAESIFMKAKANATEAETGGPRMIAIAVRMQAIGPYMTASAVCVML